MKRAMTTIKTQPKKLGKQDETAIETTGSDNSGGLAGLEPVNSPVTEASVAQDDNAAKPQSRPRDPAKNQRGVSAKDGTTKAKIERAALQLFAEHGVDGVSTKQIAAAAGISEGAIYRHFLPIVWRRPLPWFMCLGGARFQRMQLISAVVLDSALELRCLKSWQSWMVKKPVWPTSAAGQF